MLQMRPVSPDAVTILLMVKEPLTDICLTMQDCGDATLPGRLGASPAR